MIPALVDVYVVFGVCYLVIVEPAPDSLPPARGTGVGGVPLALRPTVTQSGTPGLFTNGVSGDMQISVGIWIVVSTGFVTWVTWRIAG